MRLVILGHYAGYPGEKGGCSSFLLKIDKRNILIDCGPGSLSPLQKIVNLEEIDAIWISHLHTDHYLDLFPYSIGLLSRYFTSDPNIQLRQIPVFIPEGMSGKLMAISKALGFPDYRFPPIESSHPIYEEFRALLSKKGDFFSTLFQLREYQLNGSLYIHGIELTSRQVEHNIPTAAVRVSYNGKSLTYSSDTAVCNDLVELARDSDAFLCEATVSPPDFHDGTHMSPRDAGKMANESNVRQLILTHLNPWVEEDWAIAQARAAYSGKISCAHVLDYFDI